MGYAFDNTAVQANDHHDALADLLDAQSRSVLAGLIGERCLEVGAGAGSIATWLAAQGATVLATDVAPVLLPDVPGLTVRQHDIVTDEPPGRFDLVHARLLLGHLPQRRDALGRMIAALAPGGTLVTGDFALAPGDFVVRGPDILTRYLTAHLAVFRAAGYDLDWPCRAAAAYLEAGLSDVRFRVDGGSWHGGGPGARLLTAGLPQLRPSLLRCGLTDADLTATAEALADPAVILNGFQFVQVSGSMIGELPGSKH